MPANRAPTVTPRQVFGRRLQEVRRRLGWSQTELSGQLEAAGFPLPRTTIDRIEGAQSQDRKVSIDELLAISAVVDVAPLHMIVPLDDSLRLQLTHKATVAPETARAWVRGSVSLAGTMKSPARIYDLERPRSEWSSPSLRGVDYIRERLEHAERALGSGDAAVPEVVNALTDIEHEIQRMKSRL